MHSEFVSFKQGLAKKMCEVCKKRQIFLDDLHALNIMWDRDKRRWFVIDGFLRENRSDVVIGFSHDSWDDALTEKWFVKFFDHYRDLKKCEQRLANIAKDPEMSAGF